MVSAIVASIGSIGGSMGKRESVTPRSIDMNKGQRDSFGLWPLASVLLSHELHFRFDSNLVRHQDAARFDHLVPLQSPVTTVDLGVRREAGALLAPRIVAAPFEHAVERDGHGRVPDRQVAENAKPCAFRGPGIALEMGAPESDLRMRLGIEEVRRLEVGVAIARAGVDARGVDFHLDAAAFGMIFTSR